MKHYVLFKFKEGALTFEVEKLIEDAYAELVEAVESLQSVHVRYNCVVRDQNMDMMVEMDVPTEAALQDYLSHPIHVELGAKTRPFMQSVVSFDHTA